MLLILPPNASAHDEEKLQLAIDKTRNTVVKVVVV
jgi:hypothetical protein